MTDSPSLNKGGIIHPSATYVIIDLEWNQPIPWIKSRVDATTLPGEIIEIGAVKLTIGGGDIAISEPFHVRIRPVCYTIMNRNVSRVINKISSDLQNGSSFTEAYNAFIKWCGEDFIFCGWGNSDLSILKANLRFHDRPALLGRHFLDVQTLFSKVAEGGTAQRSVEYAVDFLHISKQDDFHEAHRDAEYTGRILRALFNMIEKDLTQNEEKNFILAHYLIDPDLNMQSERKTERFESWEVCCRLTFAEPAMCPACGVPMQAELRWFRIRKSAFALFRCEDHNLASGRIRLKKSLDGKYYASVSLKLIQPGEAKLITDRFEEFMLYGAVGRPVEHVFPAEEDETIRSPD